MVYGDIAQLGERVGGIDEAGGSSPPISIFFIFMDNNLQIIDNKDKIKNILNILLNTNAIFNLRNQLIEYRGKIKDVLYNQFIFYSDIEIFNLAQQLRFSFFHLGKYHYFDTDLVEINNHEVVINTPEHIYIHSKRQHKRYEIKNQEVTCSFKIINLNQDIRKSKETERSSRALSAIYYELQQDKPDFSKIVTLISEDNKNICDDFKIIMSIDKLPDQNVDSFLKNFNRPLLLNGLDEITYGLKAGTRKSNIDFCGLKDYIHYLAKINKKNVRNVISSLVENYKIDSIYSLLYVPILILEQVTGVLRIVNNASSKRLFEEKDVSHFISIAKIINESIIKNRLNSFDESSINIKVNDISLSGIGIEIKDNLFSKFLKKNTRIRVTLTRDEKPWLYFIVFVKNIIQKGDLKNIGIEVNEILPVNHTKLINFINKNFSN